MFLRNFLVIVAVLAGLQIPAQVRAEIPPGVQVAPVVSGLDEPWALSHLPDGSLLISERAGRILLFADGRLRDVTGGPEVAEDGQGGLLDLTLPRDFATTREVWMTYAKPQGEGSGTALAVAVLSADGTRLEGLRDLFEMAPGSSGGRHFGSRVVEAADGTLFVTIGDRGEADAAQDRSRHNGSVIRINRDGSVPGDNPFGGAPDIRPEIWSWGHRNPQGAGLDAEGTLWVSEHGAKVCDEVNAIRRGANYGWPVISYGRHYSGARIGEGTEKAGMEQPAHYWDPSIAPSGLLVYQGAMFPDWQGDIFVGSLKFDYIARLELADGALREVEQISSPATNRVRDLAEAPDGSIWFISVGNGAIYRLSVP